MKRLIFGLLIWNLILLALQAQEASKIREQLSQLRTEIAELEEQLSNLQNQLNKEVLSLENIEKQIILVKNARRLLQQEIDNLQKEIQKKTAAIDSLSREIYQLEKIFKRQILFAYKYQRGRELDWILGSENFNQALIRYRFFQQMSAHERRLYNRLVFKKEELQKLKKRLENDLQRKSQLIAEKDKEQKRLENRLAERKNLIQKVTRDKDLLEKALQEKRASYKKLLNIIARLEKERTESKRSLSPSVQQQWENIAGSFAKMKGKLNWPVVGKVLHPFGRYKNPTLKTVLFNSGIDIRAPQGTNVHCVFPGVVSMITYMSGFGNTIIVDHNDGYYSVYAHLDEIFVKKFQFLQAGEIIGTVGDSGSLEGSMLHFEIYGGNKPLNPLDWLTKR